MAPLPASLRDATAPKAQALCSLPQCTPPCPARGTVGKAIGEGLFYEKEIILWICLHLI